MRSANLRFCSGVRPATHVTCTYGIAILLETRKHSTGLRREGKTPRVSSRSRSRGTATKANRSFSPYAARVAGDGNFVPQPGQFAQPTSTPRPQFGQVGSSDVPQCGQNVYPDFRTCEHPGHAFI